MPTVNATDPTTAPHHATLHTNTAYKDEANVFTLSQSISNNGGKTTLALTDTTAGVGLTIGADTNLYRSAANVLKTDDDFTFGATTAVALTTGAAPTRVIVGGELWATGLRSPNNNANDIGANASYYWRDAYFAGRILWGSPGFGQDTNLYRSAANVLKTDDKLITVVGLGVGNSAAATTPGSVTKKMEVFDGTGSSLGYVAIYDAIT